MCAGGRGRYLGRVRSPLLRGERGGFGGDVVAAVFLIGCSGAYSIS